MASRRFGISTVIATAALSTAALVAGSSGASGELGVDSTGMTPTTSFMSPQDPSVRVEVYNSKPWMTTSGKDISIMQKYNWLIDHATGNVKLAMYNWGNNDQLPVADRLSTAITEARARDVNIRMVAKGSDYNSDYTGDHNYVPNGLISSMVADGDYHLCNFNHTTWKPSYDPDPDDPNDSDNFASCRAGSNATDASMHAKFATFQTITDGSTTHNYVSVITSANHNSSNWAMTNNAVVIYGDKELYDALNSWWVTMYHENDTGNRAIATQVGTLYTSPWSGSDPIAGRLTPFSQYTTTGGCQVNVTQAEFDDSRIAVADQLIALRKKGCAVKVLVSDIDDSDSVNEIDVKGKLQDAGAVVLSDPPTQVHDKSILIKATTGSTGTPRYFYFTGSQNLNNSGWKSDEETFFKLELNSTAYAALSTQFGQHWVAQGGS